MSDEKESMAGRCVRLVGSTEIRSRLALSLARELKDSIARYAADGAVLLFKDGSATYWGGPSHARRVFAAPGLDEALRRAGRCTRCERTMNPAERMLGPVCGGCCRENHRAVTKGSPR